VHLESGSPATHFAAHTVVRAHQLVVLIYRWEKRRREERREEGRREEKIGGGWWEDTKDEARETKSTGMQDGLIRLRHIEDYEIIYLSVFYAEIPTGYQ
jgi:hypothetical protein